MDYEPFLALFSFSPFVPPDLSLPSSKFRPLQRVFLTPYLNVIPTIAQDAPHAHVSLTPCSLTLIQVLAENFTSSEAVIPFTST